MTLEIKIRFITTDGFVSASIRKLTGSLFSHVEIGTMEGTWIGAHSGDGIQERPANYCQPTREYVYALPCTQEEYDSHIGWARAQIGCKYNYRDILGLMFQARTVTSPQRRICSDFVCKFLLRWKGPYRYLNVAEDWTYRITPETCHLSPLFTGKRVKAVG